MAFNPRLTSALCFAALAVAASIASAPLGAQTQAPSRSVNDGVFTADQAVRGQKTFEGACTVCHDIDRFRGVAFIDSWKSEPLFALFETISGTMPADNPGGLRPQEYGDIIAYFLKLNGYPAGAAELVGSKEAMSAIRIEPAKSH